MLQITQHSHMGGCRGYATQQERVDDVKVLIAAGFNYFVTYSDTQASIALLYACIPVPVGGRDAEIAKTTRMFEEMAKNAQ